LWILLAARQFGFVEVLQLRKSLSYNQQGSRATMARPKKKLQTKSPNSDAGRKNRNFPKHTLEVAVGIAQKIQDEMGGAAMNRLLLANAVGLSPSSSNYRDLLSSAYRYGLTDGTEKADAISLTPTGNSATQTLNQADRLTALRKAALNPDIYSQFFKNYANKKLPSTEMLPKILSTQYGVPSDISAECASQISANGRFVEIVRDIGGSPHILFDIELARAAAENEEPLAETIGAEMLQSASPALAGQIPAPVVARTIDMASGVPKPIFVGHGKNKAPLQQLIGLLSTFQIPHKVVAEEPHLGRPISQKVKDAIEACGSAILIFTRDEKFFDAAGAEIWRPSENVVHELGATSFTYGDRIVIFKEKGLHFPSNFQSIGYIEFESNDIAARTADLLKELIGFGLVKVTPT
jgi:predicted nucleotide-binding protein